MARGRPPTGRNDHKTVTTYLPPADLAALAKLADRRTLRGKNTSRSDLIREAVRLLLDRER